MKMSTKARYGLYACAKLAQDYDKGFISTTELANAIYVSDGYLEQIVSLLKKEGVVLSQRGAFGGYKLSALPSEISVGRVLRAVEDNLEIVDCLSNGCSNNNCNCVTKGLWSDLYRQINIYLDSVSLAQLIDTTRKNRVYLDHAATTPCDDDVIVAMMPFFNENFGNSHSQHSFGRDAMSAVDTARKQVADALGVNPNEIYFTGSGTEADNWALKGAAFARKDKGKHIIVSAIEHHAILNSAEWLRKQGFDVSYLGVDEYGKVKTDALKKLMRPDTVLVSVMLANNEMGTIQPIKEIAEIVHGRGSILHVDAVQAFGALPVKPKELGADLLTVSAHKFYGPKGIGALYIRNGLHIDKLVVGGGQERSMRGGTTNVPAVVGMGYAAQKAVADMEKNSAYVASLRNKFVKRVLEEIPFVKYNGHPTDRLPSNANFSFEFVEGESLLMLLDLAGIAVSSGSACSSGSLDPSHVLLAMNVDIVLAHGSIRFSFGKHNTEAQVDYVVDKLKEIVERLRKMSPLFSLKEGEIRNV